MGSPVIDAIQDYLTYLEEASRTIESSLDAINDMDSDEYRELEIEDISNNGEIMATRHLLSVVTDILS
jgi:hypothetical protein